MGWRRRKNTHDGKSATKGATGAVGTAVGGVVDTAGDVVGAGARGIGNTVNRTTNTHSGGNALKDIGNGVDRGTSKVANGVERGSKGKNPRSPWARFKSRTKA